jgi:flagellar motility protein MotE (MotC chaperone)
MSTGQFSLTDIDPPKIPSGQGKFSLSDIDGMADTANIGGQQVNLKSGAGATQAAQSQSRQQQNASVHPVSRTSGILARGPKTVEQDPDVIMPSAGSRSGMGLQGNLVQQPMTEPESQAKQDAKSSLILAGSAIVPELLPETAGLFATAAATATGAGVGTAAGQALTGEDPTSAKSLKESATNAAEYGGATLAGGTLINGLSKLRVKAPDTEGWIHFRGSDGRLYQVHPEDITAAQKLDPKLKTLDSKPTLAASTSKAQSAQDAGRTVQQGLQNTKAAIGERVGKAKDAVSDSLAASTGEPLEMTIRPESKVSIQASDLLQNEIPGLTKSETDLVSKLANGQDADGNLVSMSTRDIERTKQQLADSIDRLSKTPGNKTAAGQMKQLKTAFDNDVYDFYEKVGDPDAAQDLRKFSSEYAKINKELTKGPAAGFFKTNKPETIVGGIIKNGAGAQSAVESLANNLTEDGLQTLRDSVTKDLYRRSTMADTRNVDMEAVQNRFASLGDTAKALYGDSYDDVKALIDTAAQLQRGREANSSVLKSFGKFATKKVATAAGAKVGGPVGAVAANSLAEELLNVGKSGAVRLGISPTETIVLTPKQTMRQGMGKLISKFVHAQTNGKPTSAIVTAINRLAGESDKTSDEQEQ